MKKNSQKKATQKLKEGDFYRNLFGEIFQIVNIDWNKKTATVRFINHPNFYIDYEDEWDFDNFPINLERAKLTPLEVELL